jgi:fumarylacetoacetase
MALGRSAWREARGLLQNLISGSDARLSNNSSLLNSALIPLNQVKNHMPADIGDYTDFYSSKEHATNVGTMFR